MPTTLIAGANRGIGLEFARQYAAAGWRVIGTAREPDAASELAAVATVHRLDIADPASITALADAAGSSPIDLLLSATPGAPARARSPSDPAEFVATLATNAVGPTLLAHALKDRVLAVGAQAHGGDHQPAWARSRRQFAAVRSPIARPRRR